MKRLGKRVYQTADGRHVLEGDPDAAFLAFTEHEDVPDNVAAQVEGKSREKPDDKAAERSADKAAGRAPSSRRKPTTDADEE